jgi:hypothetical protein
MSAKFMLAMNKVRTSMSVSLLLAAAGAIASANAEELNPQPLPPSPGMALAMPPGPDPSVKITEAYAAHVARDAFFWAWPLINIYNKRRGAEQSKELAYAGPVPAAPLNRLVMLTDYVAPDERLVACPNQDVAYGGGSLGLDKSPVVIQVPDFGQRFWVYQVVDLRTDSVVRLGKMYGTTPGFYLIVGPNWQGDVPKGISKVFRASTNSGFVAPRVFMDDTAEDRPAIQPVLRQIMMYPLAEFDGRMKSIDWSTIARLPNASSGEGEVKWVPPESFVETLPMVLADAPPMPGEEARYAQVRAVLDAAKGDPKLKAAMTQAAAEADEGLIKPLFEFRNWGQQLPYHWSTISNEAAFGADYFTRTAVAKSNILVNSPNETKYYYQDLDAGGARLCQSLHGHLRDGSDAAGERLLVVDTLQRAPLLRPERDQPLLARHKKQNAEVQSGWIVDDLRAGRAAAGSAAEQLAAGTEGQRLLAVCPRLLAKGRRD